MSWEVVSHETRQNNCLWFCNRVKEHSKFLEMPTEIVDKHNTVIERTYKLEETQAVMEEQIKVANHRIADLENQKEDSICR